MENSPIKQVFNELQELINTNPEDLSIYEKFNELRELVHKQIVENIQLLYSDDWKDSSTYQSFLKNGTERWSMERRVLMKEVEKATTIAEIQQEMVNAMNTPNIFKTNTQKSQSNQDQQPKEEELKMKFLKKQKNLQRVKRLSMITNY